MKKSKSSVLFILCVLVIAGLSLLTVFGVTINGMNKGSAKNITLGLELKGGVSVTYEAVGDFTEEDMKDTVYKLQLRANELAAESEVYQEGTNRVTVEIPGATDAEKVLEDLGKPGSLEFITDYGTDNEKVQLTGADVVEAEAGYINSDSNTIGQTSTEYVVSITFGTEAAAKFAEVTKAYVGKPIYIVYDGEVISYPNVKQAITGGSCTIDGMDSYEEADQLASVLRIGSLKVELNELTSKVVGAKLGDDAISTSLFAGLIGMIIICAFMIFVYRVPGIAASLALILYVPLELLCLNGFDMTLTLPGIAGIILSIGMAVDANVIIFARIKEELAHSTDVHGAIKTGFKKATSAIVDGNVTTFIAALVLMWRGTGPVQGFAQTLAIGIAISMFTAMVVSRALVYLLYHMGAKKVSMYGVYKERKTINFLSKKAICFAVSGIVIVAGLVGLAVNQNAKDKALNYSVEFSGGLSTTVEFEEKYSIDEFNDKILPEIIKIAGDSDVIGNEVSGTNEYVIRTKALDASVTTDIHEMLVKDFGAIADSFDEVSVSSTISGEMRNDAIIAVAISVVCMLIYIFIRFKDFGFASSAVIALLHDVLVVLTFYVLSWTTVGNTFIACMLTILGYSINATIVIFDRIRENLAESNDKEELKETINKSITQTLTRTIYSSFTTFVMVAALYVFGVTSIKEFAMPLMVGILCGAYSSVCITGALWYIMVKKRFAKKQ